MKKIKKILLYSTLFALVLIGVMWSCNFMINKNAKGKVYTSVNQVPYNKVGLVLGTSKMLKSGRVNLYFTYRIEATVDLFKSGKIDFVLISGDNGNTDYDEPSDFKDELIKKGIPENKIFLDYAGFRTFDSMVRAKKVFGLSSFTIISQQFHNERAIYIAEHEDINVVGFNAKSVTARYGIKTTIREYFARVKVFVDIILNVSPKFLGDKIEIK
jgi:SanA protein